MLQRCVDADGADQRMRTRGAHETGVDFIIHAPVVAIAALAREKPMIFLASHGAPDSVRRAQLVQ